MNSPRKSSPNKKLINNISESKNPPMISIPLDDNKTDLIKLNFNNKFKDLKQGKSRLDVFMDHVMNEEMDQLK